MYTCNEGTVMSSKATDNSFVIGEQVFYPNHGLGLVKNIESGTFAGVKTDFIKVHFSRLNVTTRIPVATAHKNGLQRISDVISPAAIQAAMSIIAGRRKNREGNNERKRENLRLELSLANKLTQIAIVIRDVTPAAGETISYSREKIQKDAVTLLAELIAAGEDITPACACEQIAAAMKAAGRQPPRVNTW